MEFETVKTFKAKFSKVHLFSKKPAHDLNSDKNSPVAYLPLVMGQFKAIFAAGCSA